MSFQGTTRADPYERSLAHRAIISDDWRRSDPRDRDEAHEVEGAIVWQVQGGEPKAGDAEKRHAINSMTCRLYHQRSSDTFFTCDKSSWRNHCSLSPLWSWRRNNAVSIQSSLSVIGLKSTPICQRREAERGRRATPKL